MSESNADYADFNDESLATLAEDAGIDTTVCEFCEEPLDDTKPWKRGLDGSGAHKECLASHFDWPF